MAGSPTAGHATMSLEPNRVPGVPHVPGLLAASSNVSTDTVDTDVMAPIIMDDQHMTVVGSVSLESASPNSLFRHDVSSSEDADDKSSSVDSFPLVSETATEIAEVKKGAKRTASGAVKDTVTASERNEIKGPAIVESLGRERRASEVSALFHDHCADF
jgi:hypothetical protein